MIRAVERGRSNSVANWLPSCSCFPPSSHPCKLINSVSFVLSRIAQLTCEDEWEKFQFPNWDTISCIRDLPRLPARFFSSVLFGLGSIVCRDLPPIERDEPKRDGARGATPNGMPGFKCLNSQLLFYCGVRRLAGKTGDDKKT